MTPGFATALAFASVIGARHLLQLWITRTKVAGARSGWVSTTLLFVSYVWAMGVCLWRLSTAPGPLACVAVGLALWAIAVAARVWALVHLREQFSSLIELRDDHRLVTSGPYAVVRHPLHLAFGLEVSAFALVAWHAWAVPAAALVWAVVAVRNRTEDAALARHFARASDSGAAFAAYRRDVGGMCPLRAFARRAASSRGGGASGG
jgi:protein-S-isoprenylcysteine O-methyltransferase Ste14